MINTSEIRTNKKSMEIEAAVDKALYDMPEDFIIRQYIEMNKAEVVNMCLTEYNEEETMQMIREEAEEKGREEGREQFGLEILKAINNGADVEEIRAMIGV